MGEATSSSPAMGTRPPLERMQRIHDMLSAGQPVNRRIMANILEVSAKTIQRDLEFMRCRLGAQIAYDPEHHAYTYVEPGTAFYLLPSPKGKQTAAQLAPPDTATLLDEEGNHHLRTICERHGVQAESVMRAILGNTLADAVCDSTLLRTIVASARVLATGGREAA